jgi:hypothetical protein
VNGRVLLARKKKTKNNNKRANYDEKSIAPLDKINNILLGLSHEKMCEILT